MSTTTTTTTSTGVLADYAGLGAQRLAAADPLLSGLLEREHARQNETLAMVAASSSADPSVLACTGATISNVTTEGYPGARYHAGCELVDEVERLAVARARSLFGAQYANVQPHSGSTANQIVLCTLMKPGDTLLGMELSAGGHLTHGSAASISGRFFHAVGYGTDADGMLDYEQVAELAREHRPKVIVCGASAYPRTVDFPGSGGSPTRSAPSCSPTSRTSPAWSRRDCTPARWTTRTPPPRAPTSSCTGRAAA